MASEPSFSVLGVVENHQFTGWAVALLFGLFAFLRGVLAFLRWLLGLAGARQDDRIAKLEARVSQADNRSMALAQVVMALIPLVEGSHPDHPALSDAKMVLKKAFPADAPDPSED